jgi:hypothetical protein
MDVAFLREGQQWRSSRDVVNSSARVVDVIECWCG